MSFNKVILMGRLTSDPELKQTQNGVTVTSFNIAVDRRFKQGEERQTDFITIVAWRQTAEFVTRYFKKGSATLICGELQTRSWEDQQGNKRYATEVVANEVSFCESKREESTNSVPSVQNGSVVQNSAPQGYIPQSYIRPDFQNAADDSDADLPF